jgi:hypothetical protein
MAAIRLMVLAAAALALAGCSTPTPLYSLQKTPPPYRKAADGTIIDNAGVPLDAEGYRLDKNGQRIQEVDIQWRATTSAASAPKPRAM